ncbi:unnamed protein product [Cylicocyclus nassatus]|uniref:U2 snRNP-associated SURP motif-containing protein n=1 Tax=Cylicocyclus nassatus TaxID=53992 RepID=A0AA36M661_CYLNA|nr:unnamed protein product [Cylicocyclus nassatus]
MDRAGRKRKAEDENEELQKALRSFEDEFGGLGGSLDRGPKAFIRSEVVNANKTVSAGKPQLYKPEPMVTIQRTLPMSGSSFEESKRLAAEKARRMLEEAHKGKGPPPQVIPSSATRPVTRPPRPGAGRSVQKSKTSNLEAFKEELKKVQQERDQRKGLRDHLRAELGVDAEALDKIAPALDKPYMGSGEYDDDPYTTNLYISNLPLDMTMEDLFDSFGSFGPLASAKILFPRTEEEKRREHLCGFCAFMSREDVDRALAQMMGFFIRGEPIRMSFAKPIVIPAQPFYVPPPLLDLSAPDPITELPFNAKPLYADLMAYKEKFGDLPHYGTPINFEGEQKELYDKMIKNATVRVVIPSDSHLLLVIQHVVEFTIREGPLFEAMLMTRERTNPLFRFLFELNHPTHVYYRWRLFSISQGDTFLEWRREKFKMFDGGSWWQPPIPQVELFSCMPRSLHSFACTLTEPSRWLPKLDQSGQRTTRTHDNRARQDRSRSPKGDIKKSKARLRKSQRKKLEQILRELTPESDSIGYAMVWCADHATCAREICECIYESLTIDETPLHKKIARLYLICDLLANAASRGVRDVFYFRQYFGDLLTKIFSALGRTLRNISARLKAEQFKQRVMLCFRAWEESVLYPTDVLVNSQNIFLGLTESKTSDESDEDLDGAPCDIDGVPIDDDRNMPIFDDSDDHRAGTSSEQTRKPTGMFKSGNWSTIGTVEPVKSKWEEDDAETSSKEQNSSPQREERDTNAISTRTKESDDSDTDGEIEEKEDILASAAMEEERRKLMREVEVKIMALQDELESKKDPDIASKVKALREKEMAEVESNLAALVKKRMKKEKKKGKRDTRKDTKDDYSKSNRDSERSDRRRDTRDTDSRIETGTAIDVVVEVEIGNVTLVGIAQDVIDARILTASSWYNRVKCMDVKRKRMACNSK